MKSIIIITLLLISTVFLTSCKKDDPVTATPTPNHIVTLRNLSSFRQFMGMQIAPMDSSSGSLTFNFVLNNNQNLDIAVLLPKIGLYQIVIFQFNGKKVWWNNVGMDVNNGTTIVEFSRNENGNVCPCAWCLGIHPTGCELDNP